MLNFSIIAVFYDRKSFEHYLGYLDRFLPALREMP